MSLREYAAARGVNRHTLSWWRWRTRSEREVEGPRAPSRFVPVVLQQPLEPEPAPVAEGRVEAVLPNGVTLRFEHRLDLHGLRDLAAVFGGA
jgi:hypothetical protein